MYENNDINSLPDMMNSIPEEKNNPLYLALENCKDIIIILSEEGNIKYLNNKFEDILGIKRDDCYGLNILSLLDLHLPSSKDSLNNSSSDRTTGLLKRYKFIETIDSWMKEDVNKKIPATLIQIDIDGFKFINNTAGHIVADNFLKHLTDTIKGIIKSISELDIDAIIMSRFGEDEISLFIPAYEHDIGLRLAEKIRKRVETVQYRDISFHSTVSIGIAYYPEHATDSKELLMKADAALLHAKELGKNICHEYSERCEYIKKINVNIIAKENILTALAQDRFEPWFQPQLALATNTIDHYEALARLRDIDGSIILPFAFIKAAESNSLVGYIDRVIIEKTMLRQADIAAHNRHVSFSVNLSAKNIGDAQLLEFLKFKISETGTDPTRLIFEITETEAIHDLDLAINFVNHLRALGCKFALDDFGVGFTSFVYLRKMNVDIIKIDGSFIQNLDKNKDDRLMVKAMVDMAKGMGIKTVAEFVENEASLIILRELGVDFAQGYLIGKPSPVLVSKY
jgi:diguanylate cyclase (GGDEF)-like protein